MDYYCSAKFTDLMVHVQGRLLYNCCKAYPERVDLDWLEANPGRLFHTDTMLKDRALMLDNKSCASCHHGCYKYEEQGLTSTRQQYNNYEKISDPKAPMKLLSIVLSTDCNLTCMYCAPEWSSAWQRDVKNNGDYVVNGTTVKQNNNWHTLWSKMKQKARGVDSKFFGLLLRELELNKDVESVAVLGGEPLLNNELDKMLDRLLVDKKFSITTGLGVSDKKLEKILKKVKGKDVTFNLSAEATGKLFELIRHGVKWKDFERRVEMIEQNGNKINFFSTISNLSILGFAEFYDLYANKHKLEINSVNQTDYMMPHVLDDTSKKRFMDRTKDKSNLPEFAAIRKMIQPESSVEDRVGAGQYLTEFSSRRSIDINFLPGNYLAWCGINPN